MIHPGFAEQLEHAKRGESDGIVMHVDTLRLLTEDEWDAMKEAGLAVAVFHAPDQPQPDLSE